MKKFNLETIEDVQRLAQTNLSGAKIKTPDREVWLAARKLGLGGSDMGAVMGVNPYKNPHQLWLEKTGRASSDNAGEPAKWGVILEEVVANEAANRLGVKIRRDNMMLFHKNGVMFANLDRRVVGGFQGKKAIMEVKTAGLRMAKHWGAEGTDEVPDSYLVQCQHYMACTGVELVILPCLIGGQELRIYFIERDEEIIASIEDEALKFWEGVKADVPPGTSPNPAIAALIHGNNTVDDVAVNAEAADIIAEIKAVQAEIKAAREREDALKGALCDLIGEHEGVAASADEKPLATWKFQESRRIDSARLKKEKPDIFEAYVKVSASRVLRIR